MWLASSVFSVILSFYMLWLFYLVPAWDHLLIMTYFSAFSWSE